MVDILMATFNGASYIEAQINSILNQSWTEWILFIRDDGSTDSTVEIIKKYVDKYPQKIFLIEDDKGGLKSNLNFRELLYYSKSDYCMFSDQDDVWLEDKIFNALQEIKKLENKKGNDVPILLHTDLQLVDQELNIISNSMWEKLKINAQRNSLNRLLVSNTVTGCTIMMNREMVCLSRVMSEKCIYHDWWIALVARCCGEIICSSNADILYRQHSNNQVGIAFKDNKKSNIFILIKKKLVFQKRKTNYLEKNIAQIDSFLNIYSSILDYEDKKLLREFVKLKNKNKIARKLFIIKNSCFLDSFIDNLKLLLAE